MIIYIGGVNNTHGIRSVFSHTYLFIKTIHHTETPETYTIYAHTYSYTN